MSIALHVIYWVSALIVLAEALNKLERVALLARGRCWRLQTLAALKAMAWGLLALGAMGGLVAIVFHTPNGPHFNAHDEFLSFVAPPSMADMLILVGVALMIVRTRIKEVFYSKYLTNRRGER